MAGKKISQLTAVPSALLTDIFPIVQGGVTYKESLTQVASLFNSNLTFLPLAGGTMSGNINFGGFKGTNAADPTVSSDYATKNYVDLIAQGITVQGAVRLGTTGALTVTYANGASGVGATLTNAGAQVALSLDGVAAVVNDRILVKNQAAPAQNGIYTVTNIGSGSTNWVMTRATDYDQAAEINPGDLVVINAGNTLASSSWLETATVVTIGTDAISFSQFTAALPISLANGGTGAALTASNGGIFYSTASVGAILAGTATAGLFLKSGASGAPSWSSNFPLTTINTIIITGTGSHTYTPSANTQFVLVELSGSGGGGGGGAGAAATSSGHGAGGSGGGYCRKLYSIASLGATATIVIGAGGAAGTAGNNAGSNGVDSTCTPAGAGAVLTAAKGIGGGGGGAITTAGFSSNGVNGGAGTNGDINISGGNGEAGIILNGATGVGFGGAGGSSHLGSTTLRTYASLTGEAGGLYGSGGAGGFGQLSNVAGGAGANGVCFITEYIAGG